MKYETLHKFTNDNIVEKNTCKFKHDDVTVSCNFLLIFFFSSFNSLDVNVSSIVKILAEILVSSGRCQSIFTAVVVNSRCVITDAPTTGSPFIASLHKRSQTFNKH